MKRLFKILVCSLLICLIAFSVYACQDNNKEDNKGVAYGLVHKAGYIGKATVTKNGDKVTDATLEEMCFPTQVTPDDSVSAEDKVNVGEGASVKTYYKTVKFNDITMTYDADENSYMVGDQKIVDYFKNEENCKAYFEAAANNNISVVIGGEEKKDIMTKQKLSKDENGYWTKQDQNGNNYSRWKLNRDATVDYVKQHGIDGLNKLTQSTEAVKDQYGVDSKYWKDSDNVSTGATWTDMYSDTETSNYYTYARLLLKADANVEDVDAKNEK